MKVGEIVPNFILKDENGIDFELYKNLSKQILLVFYPKDETPVCTSQLSDYNQHLIEFVNAGVQVVGINSDSIKSHFDFCSKLKLNFPLLSDEDRHVSKQFGALNFLGMTKRMLVLIGTDKKVLWIDSTLPFNYLKATQILEKVDLLTSKEMT